MSLAKALKVTVTSKLLSFCKHSTLHGFFYFYRSTHRCVHFTWCLIIMASIALCCFLSHMIWEKYDIDPTLTVSNQLLYLEHPPRGKWLISLMQCPKFVVGLPVRVLTGVNLSKTGEVESTHYSVSEIPFPAVTLCDTKIVYRPNTGDITELLLLRGFNHTQIDGFYNSFSDVRRKGYAPEPYVRKMHSLLHDLGYPYKMLLNMFKKPCEYLISECIWRSRNFNCSDMFRPVFTIVGYCCQFDVEYFREQVGPTTNFIAGIDAAEALDMIVDAHEISTNSSPSDGYAMLYVFDSKDRMTLLDSSITVTPTAYFDVNVYVWAISSSSYVNQLALRTRKCILETDAGVGVSFYQGCMSRLMLKRVVDLCRCLPFDFSAEDLHVDDYSACTWDRLVCIYQAIENIKVDIRHIISESECYQRCDYVQYETEVEFVKYQRHLNNLYGSHSRISVHFSDTTCMKYRREVLYTWDQMLANLGGIFGLCLGGSIISIIELVWFLLDLIFGIVATITRNQVAPKEKKSEVFILSRNDWMQKKTPKKKSLKCSSKFKFVH